MAALDPETRFDLGLFLAAEGRSEEAVKEYEASDHRIGRRREYVERGRVAGAPLLRRWEDRARQGDRAGRASHGIRKPA
jgi:hypothetical protein